MYNLFDQTNIAEWSNIGEQVVSNKWIIYIAILAVIFGEINKVKRGYYEKRKLSIRIMNINQHMIKL